MLRVSLESKDRDALPGRWDVGSISEPPMRCKYYFESHLLGGGSYLERVIEVVASD